MASTVRMLAETQLGLIVGSHGVNPNNHGHYDRIKGLLGRTMAQKGCEDLIGDIFNSITIMGAMEKGLKLAEIGHKTSFLQAA